MVIKFYDIFSKLICLFTSLFLSACSGNPANNQALKNGYYKFPEGFLWGTATSSYQVEGGIINDWSTSGLDAGKASEHYEKFEEDFKAAKGLNNNSYRFSVEWARIEPEEGKWDTKEVEHYKKVLQSLKANGLKPMLTLQHFTNPVWISKMGGWGNEKILTYFSRYVKYIVNELQGDVDLWITINEPNIYGFKGYDSGEWPPFKKDRNLALQVMKNELVAHKNAYKIIHETDKQDSDGDGKNALVGFAHHVAIFQPYFPANPLDDLQVYFTDKAFNDAIMEAVVTGVIDISIPGAESAKSPFDKDLKGSVDFFGLNYYTRWLIKSSGERLANESSEKNDLGWEIYPEGMLIALRKVNSYASKLNVPIYITENGLDDGKDTKRSKYIVSHVKKVWDAIQEGIPVKGYIHWTLMDNYEWSDKYGPKFGFMTIDRKMRDSANIYKEISGQNGLTRDLLEKYGVKQ